MEAMQPALSSWLRLRVSVLAIVAACATILGAGSPAKSPTDPGAAEIGA